MQQSLIIDKLTFTYETNVEPLFDSISLHLHRGWTIIAGLNGSGKTTLLKLLLGLVKPDFGSINLNGLACYAEQRTDFKPRA